MNDYLQLHPALRRHSIFEPFRLSLTYNHPSGTHQLIQCPRYFSFMPQVHSRVTHPKALVKTPLYYRIFTKEEKKQSKTCVYYHQRRRLFIPLTFCFFWKRLFMHDHLSHPSSFHLFPLPFPFSPTNFVRKLCSHFSPQAPLLKKHVFATERTSRPAFQLFQFNVSKQHIYIYIAHLVDLVDFILRLDLYEEEGREM